MSAADKPAAPKRTSLFKRTVPRNTGGATQEPEAGNDLAFFRRSETVFPMAVQELSETPEAEQTAQSPEKPASKRRKVSPEGVSSPTRSRSRSRSLYVYPPSSDHRCISRY